MKRIVPEAAKDARGFTRWIRPTMRGYMMACCDCGLVHELQFRVGKVRNRWKDGRWNADLLPNRDYRVFMRGRRAQRYTDRQRAKRSAIEERGK